MVRTLGGVAAGVAGAITLIMVTEALGAQLAPTSPRIEIGLSEETMEAPPLTLLFPVLGWFLGAVIGGYIAIQVSGQAWTAWAVAGVVLAATIFNFVLMAFPVWLMIVGLIVPILGGWIAQRLFGRVRRRRAPN